jgi:hypothetical protein
LGIEPPDLEGQYWQKIREDEEESSEKEKELKVIYHIKNQKGTTPPKIN